MMRWRRVFFGVVCFLAVVVFLSVLNGHRMISGSVSVLMSEVRNSASVPQNIRNYLSQQQLVSEGKHTDVGPNGTSHERPIQNILHEGIPADNFMWTNSNQSDVSSASTTVASLNTAHLNSKIGSLPYTQHKCSPRKNIVFFKMHKCSSSTVQNILFRYGEDHDLDFVIPPAGNYLGHSPFNKRFMLPLPTKEYNILCYHTRFSQKGMEEVMPENSVYVSILRDPVAMYESMFTYTKYGAIYGIQGSNPLKQFLENPRKYYDMHGGKDHAKNPMLYDFGLDNHLKDDQYHIDELIDKLNQRFNLVLITEYFHESLILFKELMCWTIDDIVYFTLNARSKDSVVSDITPVMKGRMKQWNLGDVKLYNHFNKTFWQKVHEFGEERMRNEVKQLVARNDELYKKCIDGVSDSDNKVWHPPGIKVNSLQVKPSAQNDQQCLSMARTELPYTKILLKKMKDKYQIRNKRS